MRKETFKTFHGEDYQGEFYEDSNGKYKLTAELCDSCGIKGAERKKTFPGLAEISEFVHIKLYDKLGPRETQNIIQPKIVAKSEEKS